jgi:hypothetical protein
MTPFSEAEKRAAIELWKAGIPLNKSRDQLKMNERGLRNSLPKPNHIQRPPFKEEQECWQALQNPGSVQHGGEYA